MSWKTGSTSIQWDVPYLLHWDASSGRGPLVVALHGLGEDETIMRRRLVGLDGPERRLLIPRAPYPIEIRDRDRIRIGHAWYQYDGDETRFLQSMDRTAHHFFVLLDAVTRENGGGGDGVVGTVLLGFSQGAYLGYYLALRYPDRFRGVIGIAGRAKDEVLEPYLGAARRVSVLHLHGERDRVVSAGACRESIESLRAAGLDAQFRALPGGHEITPEMIDVMKVWLESLEPGP